MKIKKVAWPSSVTVEQAKATLGNPNIDTTRKNLLISV